MKNGEACPSTRSVKRIWERKKPKKMYRAVPSTAFMLCVSRLVRRGLKWDEQCWEVRNKKSVWVRLCRPQLLYDVQCRVLDLRCMHPNPYMHLLGGRRNIHI